MFNKKYRDYGSTDRYSDAELKLDLRIALGVRDADPSGVVGGWIAQRLRMRTPGLNGART